MRDLIDIHDAYQEYEVYLVKVPQLDSIRENVTTDNNNTEATQPPSAVVEEKRPFFSTIRNKTSGDVVYVKLNMFINFYHYNMLIPDRNDTYICLCCVETIDNIEGCRSHVETEKHKTQLRGKPYLICFADNIIRRVRDNCSHCGICNKIVLKKDLDDHIETDKQHDTLKRYGEACAADILKVKSEVDVNNYINVQVAEESILLHRQYWHMYYVFPRKYFCSLCVVGGDVESLQKHLDSSNHLTRLSKCRILPEYGLSIVRTLSENHHHCGVCNTYLMVDVVDNHIKKPKHKSNLSLWMEVTKQQMPEPKEKEGIEDSEEKIEVKKEKTDLVKKVPEKPDEPEIPNEDVIIEHNGYKFCLNVLSFNAIVKAKLKFFCMCCSKHMEHDKLLDHINMEEHKTALGSTEIISEFAEHFIRKIHSLPQVWAHCGICNCRMTYNIKHVQSHIETTKHRDNFTQHTEKMLKKSEQMAVTRIIPKNPIPVFSSKSEKFSHEIEISNQKYNLNLHTFKAWHTIRGWGMYFSCCFVCQTILTHPMMYRHTRSQEHKENLKNCVILECYGTNYLKVINYSHFVYCTFCNDLVDTDSIDSHVKSDSHLEKKKCGITKLVDIDGRDSKLLNQFKKLVQPLDPNIEDVILTNEARNLESCESNLRLEHSSSRKVSADAVASSSKLSELEDDHSIKTTPMKCQYGSFGVLQEKTQNNECYKDVTQMNNSEYIILDFLQDRILLTFNAWNTIVENTFCNTCKMKFITDVKKHCNEPTHIKKVNAECYELSDGSIARKLTVKILELDEHIQSTIHLKNLKRASICGVQLPHQDRATGHMNPVSISVTYMQRNVSVQNQENATDGYVLLEFSNNKLVLTYNSWNGIVENRMTCHVCNDKYIKPDIPSIMEHCNKDQHKFSMKKKVIQANFIRKMTKVRFYCMICHFNGNYAQSQEHIYSELHKINEIKARMQAATAAGNNGIEIINCSQYFNLYNVAYQRNANGPAQTAVCNSQECIASDDCDSEDCSMNRDVGIPTEITNSLIPVAYEPTADEKITVKKYENG
ncbi:hypothetical protein EVAR_35855_1 [Eumeta japonica]|uniref:U1-type domain-containing protein n=1 Tax=Eumeta variegata TaxID=151549 RepID=A0A4C1WXM5_EUMVA|nr:hypothetical protein EVAR_35855_1 [Eumeta japonica]